MPPRTTVDLMEIDLSGFCSTGLYGTSLNNIHVARAGSFVRPTKHAGRRTSSWQTVNPRGPRKLCQEVWLVEGKRIIALNYFTDYLRATHRRNSARHPTRCAAKEYDPARTRLCRTNHHSLWLRSPSTHYVSDTPCTREIYLEIHKNQIPPHTGLKSQICPHDHPARRFCTSSCR